MTEALRIGNAEHSLSHDKQIWWQRELPDPALRGRSMDHGELIQPLCDYSYAAIRNHQHLIGRALHDYWPSLRRPRLTTR